MSLPPTERPGRAALAAPMGSPGVVSGAPNALLRFEGAAALAAAAGAYAWRGDGWAMFAILFLVPDVAMLGYFAGRGAGAALYNAGHTYLAPFALAIAGLGLSQPVAVPLALIWIAHIGFDRMLGYGLKYGDGFGHSHLGLLGARQGGRTDGLFARPAKGGETGRGGVS